MNPVTIGLLVGILVGGMFWLFMTRAEGDLNAALVAKECWPYMVSSALVGLIGGLILGWGWKREMSARIEMVDPPRERRRSTSTAMVRLDISGRSRY
jgi:hypothetical protein